ncbi:uncharacterized protein PHALS_05569 [Plasmopara halstedii]|uniref:Uncharacterized protein n=1 Tax=Plasmopara halstedii TaxID=4781 RepID=A0A0P1B2R5_PLAHL|nr:uncharacterized protein PHALS_05569 [Plasmopara halstedii]CEG48095.1 hypothetical protein PHALS_05569 [Plasmopara halstedii]|eukprot:XP_024584464.1 hypothetical protein PHALS_05569 [Plasmopara halstedii]
MSKARFSRVNDESVSGLESALFRKWNRLTKKEVWAQLQFSDDPVKSLTSSKMKIADKYFTEKDFYCRFTANDLFENDFGQEVVTVAFAIAKLEPATKEFVTMMQYKHIKYWLNKTLTAGIIFGNLKFNMDAIDIFFDLKIGTLSYFISLMNPTQPYIRSGNVWDLARLAMKAMNRDDPAQLLKYDTSLLEVLFAKWRSEYIKPTNLYEQIHGGEITDDDDETDKSIVREYADFCEPEHEISIPSFTVPRRS